MRRLEIGGGNTPAPGMTDHIEADWGVYPLRFHAGTFDEVYSAHCIEHLAWWRVPDAIEDAARVLVRGGTLEIHTVDFAYLVACYLDREAGGMWTARGLNEDHHPIRWLASRIFSVGPGDNWHKSLFDRLYLEELFAAAGLVDFQKVVEPRGPEKHGPINIGIRGTKP